MATSKLLESFFPFLKLKDKNLGFKKQIFIYIESLLSITILLWLFYIFVGYKSLFPYEYKYKKITFYTHHQVSNVSELDQLVKDISNRIRVDINSLECKVYLGNNPWLFYGLMVPGQQLLYKESPAFTWGNTIYTKNVDLIKNEVVNNTKYDTKPKLKLSTLLAHELIHCWQNLKYGYGISDFFKKPKWVMEGYASYASKEKYPYLQTKRQKNTFLKKFRNKSKHIRKSGIYTFWGLMVKHAIEDMGYSVDDLHTGKVAYEKVKRSLLQKYDLANDQNTTAPSSK